MPKLVTIYGGSGFVGRYIARRMARAGWRVRVAVRRPNEALFVKPYGDVGQVEPVLCNIRDDASVRAAVEGADAVVNLVGILYPRGRQTFDAVHHAGAERIAAAAKAAGVETFVQISAIGADKNSASAYARSKALGEEAVRKHIPGAVILRPSVVFGPQDDFFNRFARMACWSPVLPVFGCPFPRFRNGKLDLYGSGGTRFQPVYVGDVADAAFKALADPSCRGKSYELGGPTVYSFVELMRLVMEQSGRRCLLMPLPFWAGSLIGFFAGLLPVPPLTRDQVTLLKMDNVVGGKLPGMQDLGVAPTAAEAILPTYLDIYRRGGRYSQPNFV